jgi:hypothetical protein
MWGGGEDSEKGSMEILRMCYSRASAWRRGNVNYLQCSQKSVNICVWCYVFSKEILSNDSFFVIVFYYFSIYFFLLLSPFLSLCTVTVIALCLYESKELKSVNMGRK